MVGPKTPLYGVPAIPPSFDARPPPGPEGAYLWAPVSHGGPASATGGTKLAGTHGPARLWFSHLTLASFHMGTGPPNYRACRSPLTTVYNPQNRMRTPSNLTESSRNLFIATCVTMVATVILGCGPRADVVKDTVLKQIDLLIGDLQVNRAKIERGIAAAESSLQPLVEGKIRAQVEADQLARKIGQISRSISEAEDSLRTLKDYLAAGESVELAGKTYTIEELNTQAKRVISAHGVLSEQLKTMQQAEARLQDQVSVFESRHTEAKQRIAELKSQITVIDTNSASLDSMRAARQAAGASGDTLAANFDKLQDEVNSLDVKVQTLLGVEDEKWEESTAATAVTDIASLIEGTKGAESTLDAISEILKKPD